MMVVNRDLKRLAALMALATLAAVFFIAFGPARAQADNIVQGYNSKETLQPGILVALDGKASNKTVKTLPAADADHIFGVVIDPADAPFTIDAQNNKVFVATSGSYQVLVSTIEGTINPGDFVTISNLAGIAQKATGEQSRILGQAVTGFDGRSNVITTADKAAVGRILVQINTQNNPLAKNSVLAPSFLKKVSNSVAGKSVPAIRIYAAAGVFLFSAVVAILVLFSGVRGSLVALGRNPLSKHAIIGGMYKVVFTGIGVFILGLAGVYLLLKI